MKEDYQLQVKWTDPAFEVMLGMVNPELMEMYARGWRITNKARLEIEIEIAQGYVYRNADAEGLDAAGKFEIVVTDWTHTG